MKDQPKSKWRWRILRWGLISLALLITLVAAVVTEENWRGKRDWEAYKKAAEARGEHLDVLAEPTNQIPDDQNFAKARVFDALWAMKWDDKRPGWVADKPAADPFKVSLTRSDGSWPKNEGGDFQRSTLIDLQAWQKYYRNPAPKVAAEFPIAAQPQSPAADILLALGKYDSAIEAWRLASQRHYAHFSDQLAAHGTPNMSLLLEYLSRTKETVRFLQLRAVAELANGQNDRAFDDVTLMLDINGAVRQESVLIAHLVSLSTMVLALQPIYEGLVKHQWSDAQLVELQRRIGEKDFLADYQRAMRGERAFGTDYFEALRHTRQYQTFDFSSGSNRITTINLRLVPAAFFYQSELTTATLYEQDCLPLVDLDQRLVSPDTVRRTTAAVQAELRHYNPYKVLALMTFPATSKSVEKFASIQTYADLAQVACALERYRLAHGDYPETLAVLAPQYIEKLPHDIMNGQPLHYRHTDGGNFILYSVGWNETDDGGELVLNKNNGMVDREKGDWVWDSAGK